MLRHIALGRSNKATAMTHKISVETVKEKVKYILWKHGVSDRTHAGSRLGGASKSRLVRVRLPATWAESIVGGTAYRGLSDFVPSRDRYPAKTRGLHRPEPFPRLG